MILNGLVLLSGVALTEVANRNMFKENEQDMGDTDVWWAAHEQPIVTLVLLSASCILLRAVQYFVLESQTAVQAQGDTFIKGTLKADVKNSQSGAVEP